jgi:hypothetical protein
MGDQGIGGKIRYEDVDWIHVVQYEVQWWALVNMDVNLYVP